jgi:hypothetical protein
VQPAAIQPASPPPSPPAQAQPKPKPKPKPVVQTAPKPDASPSLAGPVRLDTIEPNPAELAEPLAGDVAGEAISFGPSESENSPLLGAFLFASLALAVLLLGLAAIPPWAIRAPRAAGALAHWRVQIAAAGISALCAAGVVLLIGTSIL